MNLFECFLRLLCAFSLGALIGWERQARNHTSGLRTNVLVSLGAALFCLPVELLSHADPSRVPAGIVGGVGFLAASYIWKEGSSIKGLATAATVFASAAIGTMCGLGYYSYAAIGSLFIVGANIGLRNVAPKINKKRVDE